MNIEIFKLDVSYSNMHVRMCMSACTQTKQIPRLQKISFLIQQCMCAYNANQNCGSA